WSEGGSVTNSGSTRMRADARRNREQIVAAAREIFAERGLEVPMEEIARRAEVGVGTLYRRFPDRVALIEAVAIDAMRQVLELMPTEQERQADPGRALWDFLHRLVEHRFGLLQSALLPRIAEAIRKSRELREIRRLLFE